VPFENEHAGRMKAPGGFKADSFRRKKIAPGVSMIVGRKKGETTMTAQSVRFDKDKFTAAEARKWLADHDMKPLSFEAASSKEAELEKAATADPLAAEIPEITETEAKMYDDHYPAEPLVPMGATTFAEVDAFRQAQGVHEQVKELTTMFQTLSSNIMWDPTIEDKPGALRGLVDELDGLLADAITEKARPSALQRLVGKAKDLAASVAARLSPEQENAAGLMVWKEGGHHRWFAIFSNKYRDQDVPPEILSAKAHKEFVEAVDTGAAPYPELWHYHVPGSRWGIADWLAFEESTGFSLASGTVDKGHEKEAEAIMALAEPLAVSHTLEVLVRSKEDPTIIESYRTSEISDLPVLAAANKLTGFTLTKGAPYPMSIPADKKAHLLKVGLTPAKIEEIETDLTGKAKAAEAAGLQSKEAAAVEPAPPTPDPAPAPDPEPEPAPWAGDLAALRVEMATAITDVLTGQKAIADAVVLMAKSDEARIAKAAADTPALSIAALVMKNLSAIGTDAARVGVADMGLAKNKPKEATPADKSTGVPWIDEMIAGPAQ